MSIFGRLKSIKKAISFHTPGHAGRLNALDSTEIPSVFPEDEVERAEKEVACHYECRWLRFLVNGSSIGVKSMIMAVGGDIMAPRDRHPAVDEGATLARVNLFTVENEIKDDLPQPITAEQIEKTKKANPTVKAVVVQSPDYYGQVADLPKIRAACDKLGLYMLVDGAHGAHFSTLLSGEFPVSSSVIADATNMSAHKTLRAYTQSAYLAINHPGLLPKIDESLKLLGTTSPSYILMGQLEEAVKFERKYAYGYYALIDEIKRIKEEIPYLQNDDPMRLVVDAKGMGKTGEELYSKLAFRGVHAEKYDDRYVVFIITLSNTVKELRKLRKELILCKAD